MQFTIRRSTVRDLQLAHADHIDQIYKRLMELPGNPDGIEILTVGESKIYLSNRNRLENRAIFTGNETLEELKEITAIFDRKGVDGFFEINPANFYRSDPFSWASEMTPMLLDLGYFPAYFRCVWVIDNIPKTNTKNNLPKIRMFTHKEADAYIEEKLEVEPEDEEDIEEIKRRLKYEFTDQWFNFIGYDEEKPVSISRLFTNGESFFLAWGYTQEAYRRQGHHRAQIQARVNHALRAGSETIFTVTDFSIPSSISLQQSGFKLAYNYLLFTRIKSK